MDIKAVMCDVDGTLISDDRKVLSSTIEIAKKLREKDIIFGLATGRDLHGIEGKIKEWEIEDIVDMVVASGGAEIYDKKLGIEQENHKLTPEAMRKIINHYEGLDLNFAIPDKGKIYTPKEDDYVKFLAEKDGLDYEVVDFDDYLIEPKLKLILVCDPIYMEDIMERSRSFDEKAYDSMSMRTQDFLYEYMDYRTTKANGLEEALKLHGLKLDNLLAFGDDDNDKDMIERAGIGVAMGNASDLAKSVADYITASNNEDGIAKFIEEHILK